VDTKTRTFGELTSADLGMPFEHGKIKGVIASMRHFIDHENARRTIVFVKVPPPPGPDQRIYHREVPALSSDPIGGTPR
jgi:hypothetical protein